MVRASLRTILLLFMISSTYARLPELDIKRIKALENEYIVKDKEAKRAKIVACVASVAIISGVFAHYYYKKNMLAVVPPSAINPPGVPIVMNVPSSTTTFPNYYYKEDVQAVVPPFGINPYVVPRVTSVSSSKMTLPELTFKIFSTNVVYALALTSASLIVEGATLAFSKSYKKITELFHFNIDYVSRNGQEIFNNGLNLNLFFEDLIASDSTEMDRQHYISQILISHEMLINSIEGFIAALVVSIQNEEQKAWLLNPNNRLFTATRKFNVALQSKLDQQSDVDLKKDINGVLSAVTSVAKNSKAYL